MSRPDLSFAFAQARLQSRFGERPGAADWQHLEATRDLGAVLQVLRSGRSRDGRPHRHAARPARDRATPARRMAARGRRSDCVAAARVAGGYALDALDYLPAGAAETGARRPCAGMDTCRPGAWPVVAREPRERGPALKGSPLAPLAAGFTAPPDVARAWAEHWQTLWPQRTAVRTPLTQLLAVMRAHRERLAEAPPAATSRDSLQSLERRLSMLFRRHPLSATATAAYVGLDDRPAAAARPARRALAA